MTIQPRLTQVFRFLHARYADGVAELTYAFDDSEPLVERIRFPNAPAVPAARQGAFDAALKLLHLVAGVSYYKAGVPPKIELADGPLDGATAHLVEALYLHGLAEFAYRNGLDLRGRINFPRSTISPSPLRGEGRGEGSISPGVEKNAAPVLGLPKRTLVPIGGGKDSLVAVELRNWILSQLESHIQMFELMSSTTFADLSSTIARRSRLAATGLFSDNK